MMLGTEFPKSELTKLSPLKLFWSEGVRMIIISNDSGWILRFCRRQHKIYRPERVLNGHI